jgi:hypothetical protein
MKDSTGAALDGACSILVGLSYPLLPADQPAGGDLGRFCRSFAEQPAIALEDRSGMRGRRRARTTRPDGAPVGHRSAGASSGSRWPVVAQGLPIAVGLLRASEQLPAEPLAGAAFLGELALDGALRHTPGMLPIVMLALARSSPSALGAAGWSETRARPYHCPARAFDAKRGWGGRRQCRRKV